MKTHCHGQHFLPYQAIERPNILKGSIFFLLKMKIVLTEIK